MHTDCVDVLRLTEAVCSYVVCEMGDSGCGERRGPCRGSPAAALPLCQSSLCSRAGGLQPPSLLSDVCEHLLSFNEREFAYRCLYKYIL